MSAQIIPIGHAAVRPMEYRGQRVVTFDMIDQVHERPSGAARKSFSRNREKLVEGVDFFLINQRLGIKRTNDLTPDEWTRLGLNSAAKRACILTETGYLMVVKTFNDDLAWQVQRQLVNTYFRVQNDPRHVPSDYVSALERLLEEVKQREALAAECAQLAPKAQFFDTVASTEDVHTMQEAAKVLGFGPNRLFSLLRDHGVLLTGNLPAQRYIDRGYFRVVERPFVLDGQQRLSTRTLVTGRGLAYLHRFLVKAGLLPADSPTPILPTRKA